jgi:hypothetical protein
VTFKEQVEADIDETFFRTEEFAEEVIVDGKPVPLINDEDALRKSDVYAMGLAEGEQLILIRARDMHRLPKSGEQIVKGDVPWYVRDAISEDGVFILRLGKDSV